MDTQGTSRDVLATSMDTQGTSRDVPATSMDTQGTSSLTVEGHAGDVDGNAGGVEICT